MRGKVAVTLAGLAYLLAWFLPSVYLPNLEPWSADRLIVPGWEATRAALSPIWPSDASVGGSLRAVLAVASGLSNLLFLAAIVLAVWRPGSVPRWLPWTVGGAALLNAHWLIGDSGFRSSLSSGYYLWLASFALLALALLWTREGRAQVAPPRPNARR